MYQPIVYTYAALFHVIEEDGAFKNDCHSVDELITYLQSLPSLDGLYIDPLDGSFPYCSAANWLRNHVAHPGGKPCPHACAHPCSACIERKTCDISPYTD